MDSSDEFPDEMIGTGAGGSSSSSSVSPPEEDIKTRLRLRTDVNARGCLSLRAAAGSAKPGDPSPSSPRTSRSAAQVSEGRPTSSETNPSDPRRTLLPVRNIRLAPTLRKRVQRTRTFVLLNNETP